MSKTRHVFILMPVGVLVVFASLSPFSSSFHPDQAAWWWYTVMVVFGSRGNSSSSNSSDSNYNYENVCMNQEQW